MSDLEISADLLVGLSDSMDREQRWRDKCARALTQVPLKAPQATGSPWVIDYPDLLAVKTGYYWSVRRLTLSGFTAGTAVAYLNGLPGTTAGEPIPFAQAGMFTFGRGELLLHPGDRLVIIGTSITGYIQLDGAADCFEQWYLPFYIG